VAGTRPADPRRGEGGTGDGDGAAATQHAGQLADGGGVVGDVLEHLGGDDAVERAVGEGQPRGVALHRAGAAAGVDLAGGRHGAEGVAYLFELGFGVVDGDDARSEASRFEGMAAEAATEIEDSIAWLEAEAGGPGRQPQPGTARADAA